MQIQKKGLLDRYGLWCITIFVFIGAYVLSSYVRLYGDDLFYSVFTSGDFNYFIERHMDHYQRANGRVIVHLLATSFLGMNHIYWAICNAIMLAGIVYFGAKIAFHMERGDRGKMISGGVIMAVVLGFLNPHVTRQSVYWITGSFNYVYPLFVLLVYWYFLNKSFYQHDYKWYVPLLAFLSAATVEQGSLMTFGLTLLICLDMMFMRKYKWNKWMTMTLLAATIGMLTVIGSPAVLLRVSIEDSPRQGFIELLKYNIKSQGYMFLFSKFMAPYHVLSLGAAWGAILSLHKRITSKFLWLKVAVFAVGGMASLGLLIHLYRYKPEYYVDFTGSYKYLIYLGIGVGYLLTLLYAAILVYRYKWIKNHTLPIIALILGVGSQMMMLVLPVYGPRNLLFIIFMLALYGASLIPHFNRWGIVGITGILLCMIMKVTWLLPIPIAGLVLTLFLYKDKSKIFGEIGIIMGYITLVALAVVLMKPTVEGYRENAITYDDNLVQVEKYKEGGQDELVQHKFRIETYGWVMPYHNILYLPYYKIYIDVDKDTQIQWK